MTTKNEYDVIVAGAGVGGICAAVSAARLGAKTLLVEQQAEIGGTGVHSPVGFICTFADTSNRHINKGILEECFPSIYNDNPHLCQSYNEVELLRQYMKICAAEKNLTVKCNTKIVATQCSDDTITGIECDNGFTATAQFFVDSTANGNLSAMAGAEFQMGRDEDGSMQPATLTFQVGPVDLKDFGVTDYKDWDSVTAICRSLRKVTDAWYEANNITPPKKGVLAIPDPTGTSLLFNQTRISGVDATSEASIEEATKIGKEQIEQFWEAVKSHPALKNVSITAISPMLGLREGRRIVGDYILTEKDCLAEARFDDMIAACGYAIDIHSPDGGDTRMTRIPGSGYYHIPYRSVYSKNIGNLFVGSRCISGSHEAHSSYRVIAPVAAIGQAVGTAAAIAIRKKLSSTREVDASWIRHELKAANQFVEGETVQA